MKATVQISIKSDYVSQEYPFLFRTNKNANEIYDEFDSLTPEFLEFLKNNYYEDIYSAIEQGYDYTLRYIPDEKAQVIDF